MKPIFRWTFGGTDFKRSYEITNYSIKTVLKLFEDKFNYFFLFNNCDIKKIQKLKKEYKEVEFIEQKWDLFPLEKPSSKQYAVLNGSFWKLCPPRLDINTHEIVCDNDIIFLKEPNLIKEFLSKNNTNFLIEDTNPFMAIFQQEFENEKECYNSGLYGLAPGYDFESNLIKNWNIFKEKIEEKKIFNYSIEQGLICYTLYNSKHIVGESYKFCGLHSKKISTNCFNKENNVLDTKYLDKKNILLRLPYSDTIDYIFLNADTIHFLESNRRKEHEAWSHFKLKYLNKYI